MSRVPAALRNRLIALTVAIAAGTAGVGTYVGASQPSAEVLLAMEIGAHYESGGRHIGTPYVDKIGKGQPLTVCNGITGPEVVAGRYYTPDDCKRIELPRYLEAERAAKRLFRFWSTYNVWVRASIIDMLFNLGEPKVATSTLLAKGNAGDLAGMCAQMPRWVYGTVNRQPVRMPGLIGRRGTTEELCADWGRDGHFSAAVTP